MAGGAVKTTGRGAKRRRKLETGPAFTITMSRSIQNLTILVATVLCASILAACSGSNQTAVAEALKRTVVSSTPKPRDGTNAASPLNLCAAGNDGGRRLNDLAEHVYDAAVAKYLLENASGIGREITLDSDSYAMMLLVDDASYEMCVAGPERCLRVDLMQAETQTQRDALLSSKGAYAHERARACLQRAGDAYAARDRATEIEPSRLDATYRERVLPRLIGNMMPVALLRDSSFFGKDSAEHHKLALEAWENCHQDMVASPVDTLTLSRQVSHDMSEAL